MTTIWRTLQGYLTTIRATIHKHQWPYLALFISFSLSHFLFYSIGGRFDQAIYQFWQIFDRDLMQTELLKSLWYLHTQPPLFNAILGIAHKWAASWSGMIFHSAYLLLGLSTALSLYHLQKRFGIASWVATLVVCGCLSSSSWLLYEHWLMYTFPTMALLSLSALQMHRFLTTKSIRNGLLFFVLVMLLVYLRAIFHFVWVIAVILLMLSVMRNHKRVLFYSAIIPCVIIALLFIKNAYLFGSVSTSSWLGPNLLKMSLNSPTSEWHKAIQEAGVSPIIFIKPFSPLDDYAHLEDLPPITSYGIQVLDQHVKPDGDPNFNHKQYLAINQMYMKNAFKMIQRDPVAYWEMVCRSWHRCCQPAWIYPFFRGQSDAFTKNTERYHEWLMGWESGRYHAKTVGMILNPQRTWLSWFLPFLLLSSSVILFWPNRFSLNSVDRLVLAYCLITILLVLLSATFLLETENYRIRYTLTPYWALLTGLVFDRMIRLGSTSKCNTKNAPTKKVPFP